MQSFLQKIKTGKDGLYLVYGTDANKKCWYYVDVDKLRTALFEAATSEGQVVDLERFGKIICRGWGEEPPEIVKAKIDQLGANYDADADPELEAYYRSKTEVFHINAQAEGRACYYYVLVNGKLVDEFIRAINAGEEPDFAHYGTILESGWGRASEVVKAYMKEKYNVDTRAHEEV